MLAIELHRLCVRAVRLSSQEETAPESQALFNQVEAIEEMVRQGQLEKATQLMGKIDTLLGFSTAG